MAETLEHFGTPCELPEPNIVGRCEACGADVYDYERAECECGKVVHTGCIKECANEKCNLKGCKNCMVYDSESGEFFCDTSGPDEVGKSECLEEYNGNL
jgi:hypothetical protein